MLLAGLAVPPVQQDLGGSQVPLGGLGPENAKDGLCRRHAVLLLPQHVRQ